MTRTQADLLALADRVFIKNYRQAPFVLRKGKGAELWDMNGARYLDMTAGIAVNCLGHAHPELTARLTEQLANLTHASNLFWNEQEIYAAEAITKRSFADRVFFANSGGEANEGAVKLVRRYQQVIANQPQRTTIVSTTGSFHGRTVATVSLTGQPKYREGFGPLFGPIEFVPFGDLAAARAALEQPTACAIIVEPIQAEGGIIVPPPGYLKGLREVCDQTGTLLVFDEVQTGVGRTGRMWGYQHDGITPDIICVAKGLGGGLPIGGIIARDQVAELLKPGLHGTTFGGNHLACAAALTVLAEVGRPGFLDAVAARGQQLQAGLRKLLPNQEVRGRGLLVGLQLGEAPQKLVTAARAQGLIVGPSGGNTLRLAPPLTISEAEVDELLARLGRALAA